MHAYIAGQLNPPAEKINLFQCNFNRCPRDTEWKREIDPLQYYLHGKIFWTSLLEKLWLFFFRILDDSFENSKMLVGDKSAIFPAKPENPERNFTDIYISLYQE